MSGPIISDQETKNYLKTEKHAGNSLFLVCSAPAQLSGCKHSRWCIWKRFYWRHENQICHFHEFHQFHGFLGPNVPPHPFQDHMVFWRPNAPYGLRPLFSGSKGPLGPVPIIPIMRSRIIIRMGCVIPRGPRAPIFPWRHDLSLQIP